VSPNTLWVNTIADYLPQDYNPQKTRWSERGAKLASILSARNGDPNAPNAQNISAKDDDDDDDDTPSLMS
jgi:hypothetical protein